MFRNAKNKVIMHVFKEKVNIPGSQWDVNGDSCYWLQIGVKTRVTKSRVILVLRLIGEEVGVMFPADQSP